MKKLLILVSCLAVILVVSKVCFAQEVAVEPLPELQLPELVVEDIADPGVPYALPFGYPPYPSVGAYPAYGVPYSYPRTAPRRPGARFAPPQQYQPYPLPTPGAVQGAVPPVANPVPPMYRGRTLPPVQGTLGVAPPDAGQPGQPTVFYRPTPVRNFMTLMSAPRPYIGYNPYAGYPPFPGYIPPQ